MVQENVTIAIIIIVLFVVLALVAYLIYAIQNQRPLGAWFRRWIIASSQRHSFTGRRRGMSGLGLRAQANPTAAPGVNTQAKNNDSGKKPKPESKKEPKTHIEVQLKNGRKYFVATRPKEDDKKGHGKKEDGEKGDSKKKFGEKEAGKEVDGKASSGKAASGNTTSGKPDSRNASPAVDASTAV